MQSCTLIRAKREVFEIVLSISVYATLTLTKVQAFYQCRLVALRYASPLTMFGQTTTFSGLSSGAFRLPLKQDMQHCTISHAPKGGQNDRTTVYISYFHPSIVLLPCKGISVVLFVQFSVNFLYTFFCYREMSFYERFTFAKF